MVFVSTQPDITYPTNITVWQCLFEDEQFSPLYRYPASQIAGYTNGKTKERLSFSRVKEHAIHLSTALERNYGFQRDVVSIFSQNTVWYPVAMFAVLRIGGMINGASPAYSGEEMVHALITAKSKFVFTIPESIDAVVAAAREVGIPEQHVFLLEGNVPGHPTMAELVDLGKGYGIDGQSLTYCIPSGVTNKDVCGFLNFSSGTTGLPKAVMLSHQNVIAQCQQLKAVAPPDAKKYLAQLPLFHISGLVRFLNWPVFNNDECIMLPDFSMETFLQTIVDYQIADLTLVPPLLIRLVRDPIVDKYDLSCVKRLSCSAAPLSKEILQKLEKKMPGIGFRQSYGMTESCGCISTHPPALYDFRYANTGGVLCASTIVKIIDIDTGRELGPNKNGEILAKGPQLAMGYLSNPQATAETFDSDGWLHTGDIGRIDDEGFIHIVDRIKEMIKVKGQQVAPAELEDLLHGHPIVGDCAVLGVIDDYSGERPKAYIVLKPGLHPSEENGKALIEYVRQRRIRYKWISHIEFVDSLPKNASGKILRRVLRDQHRNGPKGIVVHDNRQQSKL